MSWISIAQSSGTTYTITANPTSSATELQTSHTLTMTVASATYSANQSAVTTTFTVTINTPACNCDLQPWTAGTGVTQTAPVGSTTTVTLPLPSVATNAYTSGPAMRQCQATSVTCATTGSFTAVTLTGGTALPGWISFGTTSIDITPADGSVKASNDWVVVVTYTPTKGSNQPSYTAVTITVSCEVTSFSVSNPGTTSHTYNTFSPMKIIDASTLTFTQSPNCMYTTSNSFAYTIPSGA